MKFINAIFLVGALVGCGTQSKWVESCYADNPDSDKFFEELSKLKIDSYRKNGMTCISSDVTDRGTLEDIVSRVFGAPPPEGRHLAWPPKMWTYMDGRKTEINEARRIKERLEKEKIQVQFIRSSGHEFMVWKEKDHDCVNKIIDNKICE